MQRKLHFVSLLVLTSLSLASQVNAQGTDVAVIVNPNNSATNVTMADLRKMFAGERHSWPGGVPIKLIVRGPGCHERMVLMKLLGMSESEYKQYWTAQVVRGEADAEPSIVPSSGMVREAVLVFPGGIGLVDAQSLKPGMKILKIDGRMPGDPGYPLH